MCVCEKYGVSEDVQEFLNLKRENSKTDKTRCVANGIKPRQRCIQRAHQKIWRQNHGQ